MSNVQVVRNRPDTHFLHIFHKDCSNLAPELHVTPILFNAAPSPAATTVLPKLLLKAETMQAHSEYTGLDWKHLLIMPGDIIIVYAYINKVTAVGFNTRTNLGGRFPIDTAKKVEPQPHEKAEILFATGSFGQYSSPSSLAYKTGQYVRVCRWEKDIRWAYGFNQSALDMGRISIVNDFKKVEWREETW
ncbi:uncharacterized protein PAC_18311 [Phialocephala subalpina]|uniref:Uncharacterized protein n=1 Tax=Phialocephala subalpina TaxID=576137 RepID=A0A1L7XTQ6_9HELO|nr:uncharacterized protein PAC_18311 [Phialocephala subalpina]